MIKEEKKDTIEEESLQETASAESEEATEETAEETNGEGASKEESKENNELEELKEELENTKAELAEKADLHLRLQAEFDNFRRRTIKEKDDLRKSANADLLGDLLPVLDNFDRALIHAEDSPILEGIVMVQKQMLEILNRAGLEKVGEPGEDFDPNFHDAIMQEEKEGAPSGSIIEVLQPGYKYQDKLLRAAMVKVAK